MVAEFQVLSPLVPVRQAKFLRFCKQHTEGVWAVVDVSIDTNREGLNADPFQTYRRLPSGFVVQDMPNNYSKVTANIHALFVDCVTLVLGTLKILSIETIVM